MRPILLVLGIVTVVSSVAKSREWTDATGKNSIEAEFVDAKVTLRLPNGQSKVVDMRSLSAVDRQYVVDALTTAPAPQMPPVQPPKGMPQLVEEFQSALASNDRSTIVATIKSIRSLDRTCDELRLIVQQLLQVSRNDATAFRYSSQVTKNPIVQRTFWVLRELSADTAWLPDALLSFHAGTSDVRLPSNAWDHIVLRNEVVRLLAEMYANDKRVKEQVDVTVEQLRNAPEPSDRAIAAQWLRRANTISETVVPVLLNTAKTDASAEVRLAAIISLAGSGEKTRAALPLISREVEVNKTDGARFILLVLLSQDDSDSPQVRKLFGKLLEEYRRPNSRCDENVVPGCDALALQPASGSWAIPLLLDTAGVALDRGDQGCFGRITAALTSVGASDGRVLRFYERAAKEGPPNQRVYCDSIAKQLKLNAKPESK